MKAGISSEGRPSPLLPHGEAHEDVRDLSRSRALLAIRLPRPNPKEGAPGCDRARSRSSTQAWLMGLLSAIPIRADVDVV